MVSAQTKSHAIVVRWNDAPIGHFLAHYDNKLSFEYTIDIRYLIRIQAWLQIVIDIRYLISYKHG